MTYTIEPTEEDLRLAREGMVSVLMSEADLRLLREAAGEFLSARGLDVEAYVEKRYALASPEERKLHVIRVTERVRRMLNIVEMVLVNREES